LNITQSLEEKMHHGDAESEANRSQILEKREPFIFICILLQILHYLMSLPANVWNVKKMHHQPWGRDIECMTFLGKTSYIV
jgi:hypothetical protein